MCQFQTLHFSDEGYIVRCNECGHYQVGFASTMLTLGQDDFTLLCSEVARQAEAGNSCENEQIKNVVIPTPYPGVKLLLTVPELKQLHVMLEAADTEEKALSLLELFK